AVRELLLDGKPGLGRRLQYLRPDPAHRVPAFIAGAVGWWRGGLEDDVVGNQGHGGIKVMGVEGRGEAVHEIKDGIVSAHTAILPAAIGIRSGHAILCSGWVAFVQGREGTWTSARCPAVPSRSPALASGRSAITSGRARPG